MLYWAGFVGGAAILIDTIATNFGRFGENGVVIIVAISTTTLTICGAVLVAIFARCCGAIVILVGTDIRYTPKRSGFLVKIVKNFIKVDTSVSGR
ncbi:MAG: hypothetical protein R3C68_19450 [Myxococcota bacterium]